MSGHYCTQPPGAIRPSEADLESGRQLERNHATLLLESLQSGSAISDWSWYMAFRKFDYVQSKTRYIYEVDAILDVPGYGLVNLDFKQGLPMTSNGVVDTDMIVRRWINAPDAQASNLRARIANEFRYRNRISALKNLDSSLTNPPILPMIAVRESTESELTQHLTWPSHSSLVNRAIPKDIWDLPWKDRAEGIRDRVLGAFKAYGKTQPYSRKGMSTAQGKPWSSSDMTPMMEHLLNYSRPRTSLRLMMEQAARSLEGGTTLLANSRWQDIVDFASEVRSGVDRPVGDSSSVRRIAVPGLAGAGKTWIGAFGVAHHVADTNSPNQTDALLLCYSTPLHAFLVQAADESLAARGLDRGAHDRFVVATPELLAPNTTDTWARTDVDAQARRYLNVPDYWRELTQEALIARNGRPFGLIVVDEAQDMRFGSHEEGSPFEVLSDLLTPDGLLVLLYDPRQVTRPGFESPWTPPSGFTLFVPALKTNLRSTSEIVHANSAAFKFEYLLPASATDSFGPAVFEARAEFDPDSVERRTGRALLRALNHVRRGVGQFIQGETVVLFLNSSQLESITAELGNSNDASDGIGVPAGIRLATIDAFKGLEGDIVFIVGYQAPEPPSRALEALGRDLYTGASRAKYLLCYVHDGLFDGWLDDVRDDAEATVTQLD